MSGGWSHRARRRHSWVRLVRGEPFACARLCEPPSGRNSRLRLTIWYPLRNAGGPLRVITGGDSRTHSRSALGPTAAASGLSGGARQTHSVHSRARYCRRLKSIGQMKMGIGNQSLALILTEHCYRPIEGRLLCLGKQTVLLSRDKILEHFDLYGIDNAKLIDAFEKEHDDRTRHKQRFSLTTINDAVLLASFCNASYDALDRSDYEGANMCAAVTN